MALSMREKEGKPIEVQFSHGKKRKINQEESSSVKERQLEQPIGLKLSEGETRNITKDDSISVKERQERVSQRTPVQPRRYKEG